MNTDIQKLRSALMVYKMGNYTEAAEQMNFSPSAVSKQIMALENDLGIKLFERHGKGGITATEEVEDIISNIQQVVSAFDLMEGKLRRKAGKNNFVLGVKNVFPTVIVASIIKTMNKTAPETSIEVLRHKDNDLIEMLGTGRIDAALIALQGDISEKSGILSIIKERELSFMEILIEPEDFFLNKDHPLASKSEISFKDIINDPRNTFAVINQNPGSRTPRLEAFYQQCAKYRVVRATAEIPYDMGVAMDILKNMIAGNTFIISSVPSHAFVIDGVVRKKCPDNPFNAHIIVVYDKKNMGNNMKSMIDVCKSIRTNGITY